MVKKPTKYDDVKNIITKTILTYDVKDILKILSSNTPLGTLIPIDHIVSLEIEEAINNIISNQDIDLLDALHFVIKDYIEEKIRIFNNITNSINDDNYKIELEIDGQYLWAEKYYLDMFGIWSPRLILINEQDDDGKEIDFYEYNFHEYTLCPMWDTEIEKNDCQDCVLNKNNRCKFNNIL